MKRVILYIISLMIGAGIVMPQNVSAADISAIKQNAIVKKCDMIREDLKTLQHNDSRARVYLGRYYEEIISRFIVPLNVRLVENNMSTATFIGNQNNMVTTRQNFTIDFIEYQKGLEELVKLDCKTEPEKFYAALVAVRKKREVVAKDAAKMGSLMTEQVDLVKKLKGQL